MEAWAQPGPLVAEVLDARSFAAAYAAVEDYTGAEGQTKPSGLMVDAVMDFIHEKFEQLKAAREL